MGVMPTTVEVRINITPAKLALKGHVRNIMTFTQKVDVDALVH